MLSKNPKSHSSNIPHRNHSYFKGEEWGLIRKALAKTGQTANPVASCPASGAAGGIIWVLMDLGSLIFSVVCLCVTLVDWPQSVPAIAFSEHPMALASPVSWILHCNLNLTFPVLNVAYSRVSYEKSDLAMRSLASATDWALSTSFHDTPTLNRACL